jgi:hypothetical protein
MKKLLLAAIMLAVPVGTANASWQLIPGQPYDGNSRMWGGGPKGNHKEPCWSAATSKCAYEQSRQNKGQQNRAKTRGSR